MSKVTSVVNVQGIVQGVGFRYFTTHQATKLGVSGYAKNMDDGSVEVMISGEEQRVQALVEWLRKGPSSSKVRAIHVDGLPYKYFAKFSIEY